jgi:hypothetical protein
MNTQASLDHIESVLAGRAQWRASVAAHSERTELRLAARSGIGRRSLRPGALAALLVLGTTVALAANVAAILVGAL